MPVAKIAPRAASLDEGRVVAKAAFRAARALGLTQSELARVIGVSPATVSRIGSRGDALAGKPFELAVLLIRVFRSLDAIVGGDRAAMRAWMAGGNAALGGIPKERVAEVGGLIDVLNYLDAARAPL